MKRIFFLSLLAVVVIFSSCNKNDVAKTLKEMENIVEKAEKEKGDLTEKQWALMTESYNKCDEIINKAIENEKLTTTQKLKYLEITTRWAAVSGASIFNDLISKIKDEFSGLVNNEESDETEETQTPEQKRWIVGYKNIVLGFQDNTKDGNFIKLKTGESVKLEEAKGQEEFLALLCFKEASDLIFTFPGNAADASTLNRYKSNRLFIDKQNGILQWSPEKMTNGMLYNTSTIDIVDFNKLMQSKDPATFDELFKKSNSGKEDLVNKMTYDIMVSSGVVYIMQFNKTVRAVTMVKSVKSGANGSLTLDIIVEGRKDFEDIDLAKYLQPDEPLGPAKGADKEIKGKVTECTTGQPIGGVTIQFEDKNNGDIKTVVSNNAGEFSFAPNERSGDFNARGKKSEYMSKIVNVSKTQIESLKNAQSILEICMEKVDYNKSLRLDNIHYDVGKSDIRPDAMPELKRLAQFLIDNPTIKVELSSHTDSRSDADYNMKLSQKRADAAKKYIVSQGVASNRIISVGYGESKLLNKCSDGVPCTEQEHQLNRRTEIKMIK